MRKFFFNSSSGFTLSELLISMVFVFLVLGAVYSSYVLSQRASLEGESAVEVLQNGRVILERMTREIRQAKDMVTDLPDTEENATSTIEFEDGHDLSYIRYIRYFNDSTDKTVKREVIGYYYSLSGSANDTSTYVLWNAAPPPGEVVATTSVESPRIIGEYVTVLEFWGSRVVDVFIELEKGNKKMDFSTKVLGRNL
jgi:type II secretory pathway pseudopilin PulG